MMMLSRGLNWQCHGYLFSMSKKITDLTLQKRNQNRVNVYLDGEFAFGLSRIVAAWLSVGQELSEEKIASLQAQDAREVAFQKALRLLEHRPRSEQEIRRKLEEHQFPVEVRDEVVERLQRSGLVNDSRFAQAWIENRNEFRPRSRKALAIELRQKGIDPEVIQDSLQELDEETLAYQAGQKQARKLHHADRQEFRRKLFGFLARRGFSYDVIAPVSDRLWQENQAQTTTEND